MKRSRTMRGDVAPGVMPAVLKAVVLTTLLAMVVWGCADEEVAPREDETGGETEAETSGTAAEAQSGTATSATSGSEVEAGDGCENSGVAGRWDGRFRSPSGLDGTVTVSLSLDGCEISGSSVFTDAPCFSAADVRGQLSQVEGDVWRFDGELFGEMSRGGELLVDVSGTLDMGEDPSVGEFDYLVLIGGVCTWNAGVISIAKP